MKKRMTAYLLALAMLLTAMPMGVVAEESQAAQVPETHTDAHDCTCCEEQAAWKEWSDPGKFPTESGHYYLTTDVQTSIWLTLTNVDITLCLNGHKVTAGAGKNILTVGAGAKLTIEDCTAHYDADGKYVAGSLTGSQSGNGGCLYVGRGGELNLASGQIIDSHSTDASKLGGGGVYIQGSNATQKAVFNMTGGEISGCSAAKNGGAVYVSNGDSKLLSEFNMSGGRIHGNSADKAGAVYCVSAKMTISGDAIIENHIQKGDMGAIGLYGGVLEMSGGKIAGNQAVNGAGILIQSGAAMTMTGGEISGNTATGSGGGIYVSTNSSFTMEGGEIKNNTAVTGGGVNNNGSVATYSGGKISGNTATNTGAGVNVTGGATATFAGTTVEGNQAVKGAGVYGSTNSVITVSGGTVTGNVASTVGGGVYVNEKNKSLTVQGAPVIIGNTAGGTNSNLHLEGTRIITLGAMTEGAQIKVTVDGEGRAISTQSGNDYSAYFDGDSATRKVAYHEDGKLWLEISLDHQHCLCTAAAQGCDHEKQVWIPWENSTLLPSTSGYYYLETDVSLKTALELAGDTDIKLCLNGHTVSADGPEGKSADRVVGLKDNAKFSVTDCTAEVDAEGNYTAGKLTGGSLSGIMLRQQSVGAAFHLYGGIITGNTAVSAGGAVCVQGTGTFNIYGGEISGNTAAENGGAFYVDGGTVNVLGGKIWGNTSGAIGGGIYAKGEATITLAGGQITGNTAETAGGVYVAGKCKALNVSGAPVVTGNTAAGVPDNLHLSGDRIMTLGVMTEGAQVGITVEGGVRAVSNATEENYEAYFTADNPKQELHRQQDGTLRLEVQTDHIHCTCAAAVDGCDHAKEKWYPWEDTTTLPTASGNYYLTADVTLATALELYGSTELKICLNGFTVTANGPEGKSADRVIGLAGDAKFTVTDCTAKTVDGVYTAGKLTGGSLSGIMLRKESVGATFHMYGGILTGNAAASAGGAVCVQGTGTFNMYGGEISGNQAVEHGGAFYVDGATLNVYGGKITGNTSGGNGGGIYAKNEALVNIAGGEISKNTSTGEGGGGFAIAANAQLVVSGGKIDRNAAKSGGGIILTGGSKLTVKGGEISGNTATANGGAAYISKNTSVVMTGGKVSGNHTNESGAGFYLSYATIRLDGGSITGNTAKKAGAAIYLSRSTGTMNGGTISGNKGQNAAGIMVSTECTFTMNGGTISGGTVEDRGAGVYHNKSTGIYNGGTISGNVAGIEGGAIYCTGSTVKLSGVKLQNNQAPVSAGIGLSTKCDVTMTAGEISGNSGENGAGICIASKSHFKFQGGKISDNKVTNSGGGIYLSKNAFFTMTGGEVSGNTACGYGGGIYTYSPCEIGGGLIANNQVTGCDEHPNPRGGGIFFGSNTSEAYMHDCEVRNNHSFKDGGGVYGQNMNELKFENVKLIGNVADNKGGGAYINLGCLSEWYNCEIIGNASTSTGSGLWAADDLTIHGLTATGNTSTGTGGAVYITSAEYDGESYVTNLVKLSGSIKIHDNQGNAPDFVLSDGAFAVIGSEGLAEDSLIKVILRSGVLTQTLFGNYDYEGGDLIYTVTPGTRSATDPEQLPVTQPTDTEETTPETEGTDATEPSAPEQEGPESGNGVIYIVIGAFAVVAAAVAAVVVSMKKKKN